MVPVSYTHLDVYQRQALRRRLLDMGLTPKPPVTVQKVAPMGDPIELRLLGYELTLRLDDAREIALEAPDGEAK